MRIYYTLWFLWNSIRSHNDLQQQPPQRGMQNIVDIDGNGVYYFGEEWRLQFTGALLIRASNCVSEQGLSDKKTSRLRFRFHSSPWYFREKGRAHRTTMLPHNSLSYTGVHVWSQSESAELFNAYWGSKLEGRCGTNEWKKEWGSQTNISLICWALFSDLQSIQWIKIILLWYYYYYWKPFYFL